MRKCKIGGKVFFVLISLLLARSAPAQQFDSQAEQQLAQLVNLERARAGLPSLKVDDRLTEAARAHTTLMAQQKQLTHQLPGELPLQLRLAASKLRFDNDAENVAYDSTVEGAHQDLMHSPGHRENILSPKYNTIGIGVLRVGDVYWVTQDFANRLQEYSVNDAENAIIAAWERERRRARLPQASVMHVPRLRTMACAMAKKGKLDTRAMLVLAEARSAVAYTEADPTKLPPDAVGTAHDQAVKRIAVAACFGDGPKYPAGVWWACMVFY